MRKAIKKSTIDKRILYRFLADLDNAIADQACGCMGSGYTPEQEEKDYNYTYDYGGGFDKQCPTIKKDKPSHWLSIVLEKYFNIN